MSKKKQDTPVSSANFVSTALPAENNVGTVTGTVSGSVGVDNTYIPTNIGDSIPFNGWTTPVGPGYPPYHNPLYPNIQPVITTNDNLSRFLNQPQYWGVQMRTIKEKAGPDFWVVNPSTLASLPATAKIIARTTEENDAVYLAKVLNEAAEASQPACSCGPKDDCSKCSVSRGVEKAKRSEQLISYHYGMHLVKSLAGRILTIQDATVVNEAQNKAVKSLVKREFSETLGKIERHCFPDTHSDREPDVEHSDGDD